MHKWCLWREQNGGAFERVKGFFIEAEQILFVDLCFFHW